MIYLNEKTIIPRTNTDSVAVCLMLENQLTHSVSVPEITIEESTYFYELTLPYLDSITDGQYDFTLLDDESNVLASGIAQKGNFEPSNISHEVENNIIQYETK